MDKMEAFQNKINFILANEDLSRITYSYDKNNELLITVDLHYLHRKEAERLMNNIIVLNSEKINIAVITGYSHGTVLKEMLYDSTFCNRVLYKKSPYWNPGITMLEVA